MPTIAVIAALTQAAQYLPTLIPLVERLWALHKSGQTEVTDADINELISYGHQVSADYLRDAGIVPPPS